MRQSSSWVLSFSAISMRSRSERMRLLAELAAESWSDFSLQQLVCQVERDHHGDPVGADHLAAAAHLAHPVVQKA